jgi:hypothetical protein
MGTTHAQHVNATLALLVLILLAGCMARHVAPGFIEESTSAFDGVQETALIPSPACGVSSSTFCSVRLGLFRRATMATESVILVVVVESSSPIAGGESLFISAGGAEKAFTSIDGFTGFAMGKGPHTAGAVTCSGPRCSMKRYLLSRSFLKSMIDTPSTSLRVVLKKGSLSGTLSDGDPSLALPRFRQFYARVFGR